MRYKILIFTIVFFVGLFVLMEVDKSIQAKILNLSDYVKIFVLDSKDGIVDAYNRHFDQADMIEELTQKFHSYEKLSLELKALKSDNAKLMHLVGGEGITHATSEIHLARIISFAAMGERDRVWLDTDMSQYGKDAEGRIFGIVKDNIALGVAMINNGRLEGFINGNKKCNYDVYIGNSRAMGIVSGSSKGFMLIDYVPDWAEIHKGDQIFTSGLDGIFLENIPVGVVEEVRENYGYLSVSAKPYASVGELSYVWLIEREGTSVEQRNRETIQEDSSSQPKETQENIDRVISPNIEN